MRVRQLRSKEIKELRKKFSWLPAKGLVEEELQGDLLVITDGSTPLLARKKGVLFPTLFSGADLPEVTIDMGAVKFVANGADVMAPGVVEKPPFKEGDLLYAVDERNRKKIAVVMALVDSDSFPEKGRAFKNLHHVGDRIWQSKE